MISSPKLTTMVPPALIVVRDLKVCFVMACMLGYTGGHYAYGGESAAWSVYSTYLPPLVGPPY